MPDAVPQAPKEAAASAGDIVDSLKLEKFAQLAAAIALFHSCLLYHPARRGSKESRLLSEKIDYSKLVKLSAIFYSLPELIKGCRY
jgi:hypothetical protein